MTETTCGRRFDEALLTGYIDAELPHTERQRVELHIAECPSCRAVVDELSELRRAARGTAFPLPRDEQWRETPRGPASGALRGFGWILLVAWVVVTGGYGFYELAVSEGPVLVKVIVVGGLTGTAALLSSALLDRLHDLKTDPYRRVQK